jgi:holliday junction DNA helicase RuvA
MIAKLRGRVDSTGPNWAVVDVGGVGYLVFCSARTLDRLPRSGEAQLHVVTHVREDHIHLYGFADAAEREWFNLLQSVQSVGAKVALGVLSALSPDELARAVAAGDKAAIGRAPGVGPKLAQRIAVELRDKIGAPALAAAAPAPAPAHGPESEAVSALVNLGYRPAEAASAVQAARAGGAADLAALIRGGLKELAR